MITQKQQEDFNIELKALCLKYGVDLYPSLGLSIRETPPEPSVVSATDKVEEAVIKEVK